MPTNESAFVNAAKDHSLKIGVIGLGYVGLPLAVTLAEAGFRVIGFDVNHGLVNALNKGQSHIPAVPNERITNELLLTNLRLSCDAGELPDLDAYLVCVPTPLDEFRTPDLTAVRSAMKMINVAVAKSQVSRLQLVVLESTVAPGTTDVLAASFVTVGDHVEFAFAPERENPGQYKFSASNTPRVVGSNTDRGRYMASALYREITEVWPVSSTKVAESAKILENTYRLVNIALVNELREVFDAIGVDIREVIDAAATKPFGFQRFDPGPGIGGHCIPIDPFYLTHELGRHGLTSTIIEAAGNVTLQTPAYVARRIGELLNDERSKPLHGSLILVVGVTYKPNVSDTRESPAIEIIKLLQARGAEIGIFDHHAEMIETPKGKLIHQDNWIATDWDAIVVLTDHSDVEHDYFVINSHEEALLIDTRGVYREGGLTSNIKEI